MKILKKIFNNFGYSITRKHKTESLAQLIHLRLNNNPCECLLDVGSNVGDFVYEFNSCFSHSYCFEPNSDLIKDLKKRFFNIKNISTYELGVGEMSKNAHLYITNDKGNTLSSIKRQNNIIHEILRNTNIVDKKKIELTSLSDFIVRENLENKTFFLKTDTQGNDLEVLQGLKNFIKNIKYIKIEMPVVNIYDINYRYNEINKFMELHNFEPLYFQHITRNKKGKLIEYDAVFEKKNL